MDPATDPLVGICFLVVLVLIALLVDAFRTKPEASPPTAPTITTITGR